jgi:hypothetical protein
MLLPVILLAPQQLMQKHLYLQTNFKGIHNIPKGAVCSMSTLPQPETGEEATHLQPQWKSIFRNFN